MSLLAHLKTQTADCHVTLEQAMDIFQRVRTREDYRDLLKRFYTLYEPLEDRLGKAVDWRMRGWDFDGRRKRPLLRDDLFALGESPEALSSWPRCRALPVVDGVAAAVGCLYVLEGSTLGGQLISKHFQEQLGVKPDNGGKFFWAAGSATFPQWRAFGQWAEAQAEMTKPQWQDFAALGARQTFEAFAGWMSA